ncbi:unnamed protein product [Durusdinium trenchii]|uniref:Uncharacterized protein n=1 Tax=Durusdinium trenchii TaxID=1381693 RepID=A0ABP0IM96_9DINO
MPPEKRCLKAEALEIGREILCWAKVFHLWWIESRWYNLQKVAWCQCHLLSILCTAASTGLYVLRFQDLAAKLRTGGVHCLSRESSTGPSHVRSRTCFAGVVRWTRWTLEAVSGNLYGAEASRPRLALDGSP